jgi:hypothetical protein
MEGTYWLLAVPTPENARPVRMSLPFPHGFEPLPIKPLARAYRRTWLEMRL